ncbi:hypothetical protein LMG26842_04754 [Achromobacter dolens]|uniref:DUF4123 domain-containing protein n=1 Tax=Achromobacter dolens TaxID=1287738 RepID=UPI0014672F41|nr:DUF4123 domain-containing protein [Achromobacter dolens]CAB3889041.1 hypothetical protein LMG26842_04754 [Achromobacter dolens]
MMDWESRLNDTLAQAVDLAADVGAALNTFLLVDFRGHAELSAPLRASADLSHGSIWVGTELAVYEDIAPLLIEVDDLTRFELSRDPGEPRTSELLRLLKRLHQSDSGAYALIHLVSPLPLAELMAHFAYYGEYGLPDGREYYLHLYDSRILDRTFQVWTPAERARFLAPFNLLRYPRRDGALAQWTGPGQRPADDAPRQQPFTLAQHQALLELDYPDKLAVQIRRIYLGVLGELRQDELVERVTEQMARARSYGIASERDMLDYVAWGITISPRFDEHEAIAPALRAFQGEGLSQALAHVPDAVWDGLLRAEQEREQGVLNA